MPNRLSRLLSRTKEKEAEAEAERAQAKESSPSPPPSYTNQAEDYDRSDVIDPPDITAGFSNLDLSETSGSLPQVSECIAHLKVLESFYRLRQEIGSSDGLFGIDDKIVRDAALAEEQNGKLLAKLAEKRWAIYVTRAVDRFEKWSASLFPSTPMISNTLLGQFGASSHFDDPEERDTQFKIDKDSLPPVDVLMVWHAYMLNPRAYLEDCIRLQRMPMWHGGFPWQAAVQVIDSTTFAYQVGETTSAQFSARTGMPWDNLDDLTAKTLVCPNCESKNEVEYTTCPEHAPKGSYAGNEDGLSEAIDNMLSAGSGYCDKDFEHRCQSCKQSITRDKLKAKKFCEDLRLSQDHNIPMGGTILAIKGIPYKFRGLTDYKYPDMCGFPNDLVQSQVGKWILDDVSGAPDDLRMERIRDVIEKAVQDKSTLRKIPGCRSGVLVRGKKIGIRKMMSRYWENDSPFALDLVGAVIRQGSFIEKMHNIDWLHSPALPSTMKRLLTKYERFVSIMKDPNNMAVPTLDVDLAWHTHQLSPFPYMVYTVKTTRQFIDHDDKVPETKLNDAFAWTSKTYQRYYGEPYSECTCWYCEAIRESHTSAASRLFHGSVSQANDRLHAAEQDPRKSVHISAHNAVRPSDAEYEEGAEKKLDALEKQYQKACERARKKGRRPPKRDDYYYSDAWGYPVYVPAYNPYVVWCAYTPMYYPISPGCMALTAGSYGNCCSGTCGGGVAAGGCAGAGGAGSCAGGAAGGCGGGGACGGGGGGCGGGGGGGCGGGGGG